MQTALPAQPRRCPRCQGAGSLSIQFRPVHWSDVSPCDSERDETCSLCRGKGVLDTLDCTRCHEEIDVAGGEFVSIDGECRHCDPVCVEEAEEFAADLRENR